MPADLSVQLCQLVNTFGNALWSRRHFGRTFDCCCCFFFVKLFYAILKSVQRVLFYPGYTSVSEIETIVFLSELYSIIRNCSSLRIFF